MSDDDSELRDLIIQTLENRGVIQKLKAQLRSEVFLALDENNVTKRPANTINNIISSTDSGKYALAIVANLLDCMQLKYTSKVFFSEIGMNDTDLPSVADTMNHCHLENSNQILSGGDFSQSVLAQLLAANKGYPDQGTDDHREVQRSAVSFQSILELEISEDVLIKAEKQFKMYDRNSDGKIDKTDVRSLFQDICPNFSKNMLERHLTDEFRSILRISPHSEVTFDEFKEMLKRLFLQCKDLMICQSGFAEDPNYKGLGIRQPSLIQDDDLSAASDFQSPTHTPRFSPVKKESPTLSNSVPVKEKGKSSALVSQDSLEGSDSFFDDPLQASHQSITMTTRDKLKGNDNKGSALNGKIVMEDPLNEMDNESSAGEKSQTTESKSAPHQPMVKESKEDGKKNFNKKLLDLGFDDPPSNDYQDDFSDSLQLPSQKSNSARSEKSKTSEHERKSISSESSKTDKISKRQLDTPSNAEIEEDIEENISFEDNDVDDVTVDKTIESDDSFKVDYMEDLSSASSRNLKR